MGADKNSSPKRELGQYPKFTTTDSHTSLPRSRSHNGRTNPRNKPQTIPKRKHEAKSKGLSCPETTQETCRDHRADCSRAPRGRSATHGGRSVKHRHNDPTSTSSRGRSVPRPQTVREQLVPRGLSAKPLSTKSHWPTGSKRRHSRTREEQEEHLGQNAPHGLSAPSSRTVRQVRKQQPENQLESTLPPILPCISQTVEALEERFGEDVKRP
jgi:hypothetical protein